MSYPHPLTGAVEAAIDGTDYIRTAGPVIIAVRGAQQVVYCAADAWPASPAAMHADRLAEISRLEARLAELRAETATKALSPAKAGNIVETIVCELCGQACRGAAGLSIHMVKAHKKGPPVVTAAPAVEPASPAPAAPAAPAPRASTAARLEELNAQAQAGAYRCPVCGRDTFTESLGQPGMCVACAKAAQVEKAA